MDMLARADRCAGFADMFSVFYDLIALSDITHSKFVINGDILGSCYGMFRPIRGEPGKQRAPGNVHAASISRMTAKASSAVCVSGR